MPRSFFGLMPLGAFFAATFAGANQVHFRIDCESKTLPDQFPKYAITRYSLTAGDGRQDALSIARSVPGQRSESVVFDTRQLRENPPIAFQDVLLYTQTLTNGDGSGYVHVYQNPTADLSVLDIRLPNRGANTPGVLKSYLCTLAR